MTNGQLQLEHAIATIFASRNEASSPSGEEPRGTFGQRNFLVQRTRAGEHLAPHEETVLDLIFAKSTGAEASVSHREGAVLSDARLVPLQAGHHAASLQMPGSPTAAASRNVAATGRWGSCCWRMSRGGDAGQHRPDANATAAGRSSCRSASHRCARQFHFHVGAHAAVERRRPPGAAMAGLQEAPVGSRRHRIALGLERTGRSEDPAVCSSARPGVRMGQVHEEVEGPHTGVVSRRLARRCRGCFSVFVATGGSGAHGGGAGGGVGGGVAGGGSSGAR